MGRRGTLSRTALSKFNIPPPGLNCMKSVLLSVLMISMSISVGIVEISRTPWLIDEAPNELEPPAPEPMYTGPADWELVPSSASVTVAKNTAIPDVTFTWTAWSSNILNSTTSVYTSGDSGWHNSIVIDSNDKAHIVFYRDDNSNLMYSTNKTGSWVTSSIETSNNVGKYCNLAIDSNDGLHVSYQYNSGNELRYAYKSASSSSWSTTTIDNTGGKFTSIALDSNDKPHIAYRDSGGDLGYAEKTGGSWSFSAVQSVGDTAFTSIAIDSNDDIHIAYYDANIKDMFHLTDTSGSWVRTTLEDIGSNTGGTSLDIAIDPTTDEPGISYFDLDATSLKYTYYTGTSWSATTVENSADYGRFNSIAYDSLGNVHISHELNGADDLYYTSDKTGSWVSTAVHTTNSAGTYTAIAVDSNDDIHIAYRYNTGADLYHATVQGYNAGSVTRTGVTGATCSISPSIPNGLILNQGTCTVSGTPTTSGSNLTYNVTATSSTGVSKTGEFSLWVTPPKPSDIVYSSHDLTLEKGTPMTTTTPSTSGGAATSWEISPSVPNGLAFSSSTGAISGTPSVLQTTAVAYTVWANNSGGSALTEMNITINDAAPNIDYGGGSGAQVIILYLGQTMQPLTPTYGSGSGMPTSCSSSPSPPAGLFLSSTCVITGTPTSVSSGALYTITATNSGGSETALLNFVVRTAGGALTITPTNTEGSVNSSISDITMSYTHQTSNYGWTSGVSNSTSIILTNLLTTPSLHLLGVDSGERGEMVIVYAHNDTSSSSGTYSLGMTYRWNGTWTETILDTATDTGHHPSVAIDRQGAIHIAYTDYSTNPDVLRYATNASGTWVFTTLGYSASDNGVGRGTALVVHPITDAVHIVATTYENSSRGLRHYTNENGSWTNETITDSTKDEGHDPAMAMDGDGNLHVVYYCDTSCSDLRLSSRINGVWQNETVASTNNIGKDPDIAIDSQGTIYIVSQYTTDLKIHLHSGTPGSWTAQTGLSGGKAYWPVVGVDSNDAVHISYHYGLNAKDVMYMTNASGSWSTASNINEWGGWGSEMIIDANDDIFIPNIAVGPKKVQLTTVEGSGQGLTARPIYDISPMLPDGLTMNWRNGTISGTPTEVLANTTFTVTVAALGTTTTATFTLYVTGAPGVIAYSDISGTKGTTITSVIPSITTNGTTGSVTSWAINASLPSGLTFETSNGTIWGTPTVVVSGEVFTIWANNSVGSKSTTVNITVNEQAPGPFEYNPENNTLTNNSEVHLAPQFITQTTGNGSTWRVADINSGSGHSYPGYYMAIIVGDTLYFSANVGSSGTELWAHDTSN
ncbi:MAG: putative Ig domain-containing protein, partial [Candidatus Poseidoniales archaeon]